MPVTAIKIRSLAHVIADIRSQLDVVGLRSYRESLRLVGARDQLVAIQHAVEGARHVVEFHFASCPTGRNDSARRELVMNLRSLHEDVEEARRRLEA